MTRHRRGLPAGGSVASLAGVRGQSGKGLRMHRAGIHAVAISPAVTGVLAMADGALADHPHKGGRYVGSTNEAPLNGFAPPVTFKVSGNGKQILAFQWAGVSCFGGGGFGSGDPWKKGLLYPVGTIKVASNGAFSIKNSKRTNQSLTTTSTVTGRFTSASLATGTIRFSQKAPQGGQCSYQHTFTATLAG